MIVAVEVEEKILDTKLRGSVTKTGDRLLVRCEEGGSLYEEVKPYAKMILEDMNEKGN